MGIFDSTTLPAVNTSQISSTNTPAYYQAAQQQIIGGALNAANTPYQAYGGQRIADLTPDQLAAFQQVQQNAGSTQPTYNAGIGYATQAGAGVTPSQINQYMSPYTNDVVNSIADLGTRNLTQNILPQVSNQFEGSGGFGGDRNADFTQRAIQNSNESILNQQAQALNTGYQSAVNSAQAANNTTLNAGLGLGQLASGQQTANLTGAAALQGVGQAQQTQNQSNLSLGYNDFLTQQNYPKTQLSFANSILQGSQQPTTTTTTASAPATQAQQAPSALGQIAGAGIGLAALYGAGSSLGWFAKGGAVKAPSFAAKRMQPRTHRNARAGIGSMAA